MTHEQIKDALVDWFSKNPGPCLELPDGYFGGRPFDNSHKLTFVAARPHKLILELDEQVLLVFTDCKSSESGDSDFSISNFKQLTVDRQGYGDMKPHHHSYGSGTVRFRSLVLRNG